MSDNSTEVEQVEELDLTDPTLINELTQDQIDAAGEKKKYVQDAYYAFQITTATSKNCYSKPRLKNGELNADAKGSVWVQFSAAPITKSGAKSHKLPEVQYQNLYLYNRMSKAAMERAKYTPEQIKKVLNMGMPETYDNVKQFVQAFFPERFTGPRPKKDFANNTYSLEGVLLTAEAVKRWFEEEKSVVLGIQREIQANPKILQGRKAYFLVSYPLLDKSKPEGERERYADVMFPYALNNPPKDKDGVLKPILDPEVDFG